MTERYQCWDLRETEAFDEAELFEGNRDGRRGEPEPAYPGNRSAAYHHGWWCGARDAHRFTQDEVPWLRELARQYLKKEDRT